MKNKILKKLKTEIPFINMFSKAILKSGIGSLIIIGVIIAITGIPVADYKTSLWILGTFSIIGLVGFISSKIASKVLKKKTTNDRY